MKKLTLIIASLTTLQILSYPARSHNIYQSSQGMISYPSQYSVQESTHRLKKILKAKGMKVFAVINHSKNANSVGLNLRPTSLIIFGNPKIGTLLMNQNQSIAIDLPQKFLIWQDDNHQVQISYKSPYFLAKRHKINPYHPVLEKVSNALRNMTLKASGY